MKNHVFLSAIYFLVICCLLNILELSIIYAQPTSLGWNGEYIIPLNEFTDSKNWVCNYQPATGDACYVNTDSASLNLHWIFSGGNRYKYAQCYQVLNPAVSLADVDIIALDVKGTDCDNHRDIKIKFEDGVHTVQLFAVGTRAVGGTGHEDRIVLGSVLRRVDGSEQFHPVPHRDHVLMLVVVIGNGESVLAEQCERCAGDKERHDDRGAAWNT